MLRQLIVLSKLLINTTYVFLPSTNRQTWCTISFPTPNRYQTLQPSGAITHSLIHLVENFTQTKPSACRNQSLIFLAISSATASEPNQLSEIDFFCSQGERFFPPSTQEEKKKYWRRKLALKENFQLIRFSTFHPAASAALCWSRLLERFLLSRFRRLMGWSWWHRRWRQSKEAQTSSRRKAQIRPGGWK